jgi:selenocysteine lyase/cysteine desulfurase
VQSTQLYLDTARLGQMSQQAQQMLFDFTRLAGEEGGSLFFERFLQEGSDFSPDNFSSRFPSLTEWHGVGPLKQNLRSLAGSDPELPVLMVNRSTQLMKFAARLLFQRCRNVLVTDLCWPPYRAILEKEAQLAGRPITLVNVRRLLAEGGLTEAEVIQYIQDQCRQCEVDGLFLTAVSHLGQRLPLEKLVQSLEAVQEIWAIVVDGAQDFCHASADLSNEYCDLYLAGCHKWLRGFHPMGLGYYGRNRSRGTIQTLLQKLLDTGELDDPLLRFTTQLEGAKLNGETETVNLVSLFTCQGAAMDALEQPASLETSFQSRRQNLIQVADMTKACGWRPLLPAEPFRTGIMLLQAERADTRTRTAAELRRAFAEQGVALTAYPDGFIRLSMPVATWQCGDIDRLEGALRSVA